MKSIVKCGTGCVGAISIEILEPTDAPGEYILEVQRGGNLESQFTRGDLVDIQNAIGVFLKRTEKAAIARTFFAHR